MGMSPMNFIKFLHGLKSKYLEQQFAGQQGMQGQALAAAKYRGDQENSLALAKLAQEADQFDRTLGLKQTEQSHQFGLDQGKDEAQKAMAAHLSPQDAITYMATGKLPTAAAQAAAKEKTMAEELLKTHTPAEVAQVFPNYFKKQMGEPGTEQSWAESTMQQKGLDSRRRDLAHYKSVVEKNGALLKNDETSLTKMPPEAKQRLQDELAAAYQKIAASGGAHTPIGGSVSIAGVPVTPPGTMTPSAAGTPFTPTTTMEAPTETTSPFDPRNTSPFSAPTTDTGASGAGMPNAIPDAPADPSQRKIGQQYVGQGGKIATWTGQGWQLVNQ